MKSIIDTKVEMRVASAAKANMVTKANLVVKAAMKVVTIERKKEAMGVEEVSKRSVAERGDIIRAGVKMNMDLMLTLLAKAAKVGVDMVMTHMVAEIKDEMMMVSVAFSAVATFLWSSTETECSRCRLWRWRWTPRPVQFLWRR